MLFSILIANYNQAGFLSEAFDSIINQDYKNWEIVIIDDSSTDNSIEIVESYIRQSNNIKLFINQENFGVGTTKHLCIQNAIGELCGFLDPDDVLKRNAIYEMVKAHEVYPEASLIYSSLYYCDKELRIEKTADWIRPIPENKTNLHVNYISQFTSFKRKNYLSTEGINTELKSAVDKDLYYKLEETGKAVFLPKILYLYRENDSGVSQGDNFITAQNNHRQVIKSAYLRRKKIGFPNITKWELFLKVSEMFYNRAGYYLNLRNRKIYSLNCLLLSAIYSPLRNNRKRMKFLYNIIFR